MMRRARERNAEYISLAIRSWSAAGGATCQSRLSQNRNDLPRPSVPAASAGRKLRDSSARPSRGPRVAGTRAPNGFQPPFPQTSHTRVIARHSLQFMRPEVAALNRSPNSLRVSSATSTVFGSAMACSLAARFGVSPTTPRSCAAPLPMWSPTTTTPVATPIRIARLEPPASSRLTASTRAPARPEPLAQHLLRARWGSRSNCRISSPIYLATKPPNRWISSVTANLVSADDLAKFFDVEPRGERGRTDEVAEHHG